MNNDNDRTSEASSEESDSEFEDGGDGVNYSANFVTDTFFPTFDDAVKWADAVAINLGFILVKSSYNKTRDGRPYRYLRCDRGRNSKPRDLENAIRMDTKTKAYGFPSYIKIYYEFIIDSWKIRAKNDATGTHNHPMIVYQEGHRKISGLSSDAKKVVRDMTKSKVTPCNIMAAIAEQFPNDHPNIRIIYNCRNDLRTEMSDGRGVVHQFIHLARQSQYIYWVMSDDLGVLQHAFMMHPITVNILRTYPYVIGMDSTYKTNRYGMPFFEIVGVTPKNQNFLVNRELGLCAALREVFPGTSHLLCRWHINKDVEARVTDMFKNKRIGVSFKNDKWKRIIDAATEAYYNAAIDTMKARWASSLDTVWAQVHCHIGSQIIAIHNGLEASRSKIGLYIRQIHPFWKTMVICDGVDVPMFVNDSTEEAAHFRSLVDEVIGSDPAVQRNVSRIIEEELHSNH
ncbi:uncharacterized protein LOC110702983 [Chenopodium quinoa]|uniref:uncharacterized protein LOC110702983 n=1 Tax=Chenopodium quinoa TaxID=63459 RepID=UPI000B789612|nr:uncharacterized protein LOC110702983 [Chenopodium quinoa]